MSAYRHPLTKKYLLAIAALLCSLTVVAKPLSPVQIRLIAPDEHILPGQPVQFKIALRLHAAESPVIPQLTVVSDSASRCGLPQPETGMQYSLVCTPGNTETFLVRVEADIEYQGKHWQAQDQFLLTSSPSVVFKSGSNAGVTRWRGNKRIVEYGL